MATGRLSPRSTSPAGRRGARSPGWTSAPAPPPPPARGLPPGRLAEPIEAGEVVGTLSPDAASALRLVAGIPVVAGVVDAFASFHGARMLGAGDAIDVGGSAGGFGVYWDRSVIATGSFTTPAPLAGHYVVGGAMAATGKALEWLRDAVLGGGTPADRSEERRVG